MTESFRTVLCACSTREEEPVEMRRLYARETDHGKREWRPIGWYCKRCKAVILE